MPYKNKAFRWVKPGEIFYKDGITYEKTDRTKAKTKDIFGNQEKRFEPHIIVTIRTKKKQKL